MSHKHHGGPAPVPPGNQSRGGRPADGSHVPDPAAYDAGPEAGFQTQDPERRLGAYTTAGEHARQQPGPLNDGGVHGK